MVLLLLGGGSGLEDTLDDVGLLDQERTGDAAKARTKNQHSRNILRGIRLGGRLRGLTGS